MGSMSVPYADGGISQAMAGGEDGVVVAHGGSEGARGGQSWGVLAQLFSQGRGCEVVVDRGGMVG